MDAPGIPRARIALTPVSWGVFPRWGHVMDTERVLGEMQSLAVAATEVGPPGFLPSDTGRARDLLTRFGLQAVAGAVSISSIDPADRARVVAEITSEAGRLRDLGCDVAITVVRRGNLPVGTAVDPRTWRQIIDVLDAVEDTVAGIGLRQALHPHVNTLIETREDMLGVAERSRCGWCFDTAHIAAGGLDPVTFAADLGERIAHIHLKDAHAQLGPRMVAHDVGFEEAIRHGVFRPLGDGALSIDAIIDALGGRHDVWWVLEQDMAVPEPPPAGGGPVREVARSLDYALARSG